MILPSAKSMVVRMLSRIDAGFLEVVCPAETLTFGNRGDNLRAMVVVHDERFFERVVRGGEIGIGEAYMDGLWSSPDLVAVIRLAVRNIRALGRQSGLLSGVRRLVSRLDHARHRNTLRGSRENIRRHYDLGNDFFELFLGSSMAYSCAYFEGPSDTLDAAQVRKFERICQKLRLSSSDHLLEIGSGWGGFSIYAASRYCCRVTTATISAEQHAYAQAWVERSGLSGQVQVLLKDYRELSGAFDRIASIEMFEAVGFQNYDLFFSVCDRLLKPDGAMLLQTINLQEHVFRDYLRDQDWIQKYIFPGGELASVAAILQSLARSTGMSMSHAEDIGPHYARTLNEWRRRFFAALPEVRDLGFSAEFIRMWDYYLAYCEGAFLERHIGDFQLLLTKNYSVQARPDQPAPPLTRHRQAVLAALSGSSRQAATGRL